KTKHTILALLVLLKRNIPRELHQWLHLSLTSYDVVSTAFALQAMQTFRGPFYKKLQSVDKLWREKIKENTGVLQIGRTHLQDALPITIGFWLAVLHNRYVKNAREAKIA